MQEDPLSAPGITLADRWRIERRLGEGGMSTVYLARDLRHERDVALKVLRPEIATGLGAERFLREIQIAARLSHPHIVPLFDSAEVDGRLLFVMPHVVGESLRDRIARDGPLPIADGVEIARQVASALEYAHGEGVVHRDIKPGNILLQAGQAVVADFGIARAIDAAAVQGIKGLTETGMSLGTPSYMSPEQIAGDPVGAAADVYSLGCVLFEMLTGTPPYEGPTANAVLGGHMTQPVPSPRARRSEVTRALEHTVLAALAKRPEDRFASAGAFGGALAGTAPVPRRRLHPARVAAVVGGVAALLAVAALGWQRWGLRAGSERHASVAVLYLDNSSPDSDDQYLADGITEETIGRLSSLDRLTVPSRGMVRRFRGGDRAPTEVGAALGVDYLVGGSLNRGSAGLRVRVELVRASSGEQVWFASFDLADGDLLAVQDSIARTVAREVVGQLAPAEQRELARRPTENREAYDHYLRGNFYLSRRTSAADGRRALREYEAALALEPRFAEVLGRVGLTYGVFAFWPWDYPGLTTDSLVARGLVAANRAIETDSASPDGWLARGFLLSPAPGTPDGWRAFAVSPILAATEMRCYARVPRCLDSSRVALERVTRLAPRDAEGWYQYGRMRPGPVGDSAIMRSLALEPDRAVSAWLLGWRLLLGRDFAAAHRMLDSAIALGRGDRSVHSLRLESRLALGDLAGAAEDLAALRALPDADLPARTHLATMRVALAMRRGDTAQARRTADSLARANARAASRSVRIFTAAALSASGAIVESVAILESVEVAMVYSRGLSSVLWDPARSDTAFQRVERRFIEPADLGSGTDPRAPSAATTPTTGRRP